MAEAAKDKTYLDKGYVNYSGLELPERDAQAQAFLKPLFRIGTAAVPVHIKTSAIPIFDIQMTTAKASGAVRGATITLIRTVTSTDFAEALKVRLAAEVTTGSWANAIAGHLDYGTAGDANGGLGAAICADLMMPNKGLGGGSYATLDLEIGGGASTVFNARPVSFIRCGCWQAQTLVQMDLSGYLFDLADFTEGSNKLIDNDGGTPSATGGIRIRSKTKDLWLLYRDSAPA